MDNRKTLVDIGLEDALVFDNPDFDTAIVGTTDDGRVVYDYNKMVEHLSLYQSMTFGEAVEFIDCNTLRTIPYMGPNAPVIIYNTEQF